MASIKLFRDPDYLGGSIHLTGSYKNLGELDFNDVISSVVVESGTFTLYQDPDFEGWSVTVSAVGGPANNGEYPNADSFGDRNDRISSVRLNSGEPASQ